MLQFSPIKDGLDRRMRSNTFWDDWMNSDPVGDILNALEEGMTEFNIMPTTASCSIRVYRTMMHHPDYNDLRNLLLRSDRPLMTERQMVPIWLRLDCEEIQLYGGRNNVFTLNYAGRLQYVEVLHVADQPIE